MRKGAEKSHSIDILFQMVIFLLFTFSTIALLLLSVNFYHAIVERSDENESARVAVAYIREIIHQNDEMGAVTVTEFDGVECLKIQQSGDYILYLYLKDGELHELYTKEGAQVTSDDGHRIMYLENLNLDVDNGLIIVECEDAYKNCEKVYVSVRSVGGQTE